MPGSITASNAVVMMSIPGLFDVPQQIQGFSADDVFSAESIERVQTKMGIDGRLSAGKVFVEYPWNLTLQADSPSNAIMDTWSAAENASGDVFFAQFLVVLSSIGTKWTMTNGVFSNDMYMPDAKQLLQARKYGFKFESVSPAAI